MSNRPEDNYIYGEVDHSSPSANSSEALNEATAQLDLLQMRLAMALDVSTRLETILRDIAEKAGVKKDD